MALLVANHFLRRPRFTKSCLLRVAYVVQGVEYELGPQHAVHSFGSESSQLWFKQFTAMGVYSSTGMQPQKLCWEGSAHEILLTKLETSLKNHELHEAWETFRDFKKLYGFPMSSLMDRLIATLCYSSDALWLQRATDLVLQISKQKADLLKVDTLTKLSLSMARSQMPLPASIILRLMLERRALPENSVLCVIVFHMVKTETGTCIASNFLVQICECHRCLSDDKSNLAKIFKPDTLIFNLVLDACVRFKFYIKGQGLMELMAQTGTTADASSIVLFSRIQESNGLREELMKLKSYIDQVPATYLSHYCQFYDSLLSLHFELNDIDAAAELVLDMNKCHGSMTSQKHRKDQYFPCFIAMGSQNLRNALKIQILPELLQKDSVLRLHSAHSFVYFNNGKLVLSDRALAKFIIRYKREGRTTELSKLLLSIQNSICSSPKSSLLSAVINACIHLGWLETAHDILDDIEACGISMDMDTYMSVLAAYQEKNMSREVKRLLKQMREAGLGIGLSDETIITSSLCAFSRKTPISLSKSSLEGSLLQELGKEEDPVAPILHDLNYSIYFFCKAKMIDDASKTYRKMLEMKIQPTVQTFANLVYGYSSMGMHREITILWGDIKRSVTESNFMPNIVLLELLVLNFIQGGYFERVMEVISYMEKHNIFADKWMFKAEFLRLHRNLYRSLRALNAKTVAQSRRLEYVCSFRKWAGIY